MGALMLTACYGGFRDRAGRTRPGFLWGGGGRLDRGPEPGTLPATRDDLDGHR